MLVKFGYYASLDDINALIPELISLLDGKNDHVEQSGNSISEMVQKPFTSIYICTFGL